jgi:digeranylgeranylglycerophospholipid reductase
LTPGGYAWVFPKSDTTANVGLGYSPVEVNGSEAFSRLDTFIKRRFGTRKKPILEKTGGVLSIFKGRKLLLKKNVLLAGDAARVFDSLTGAGIGHALLSGQIAGQTTAEFLTEKQPSLSLLKQYPERFMKIRGRHLRYLLYARNIFLHMSDNDYSEVLGFLRTIYHQQTIHAVNGIEIIKNILRNKPQLLALARHLIW